MIKKFYEENLKWDILTKNLVTFTKKKHITSSLSSFVNFAQNPYP